MHRPSNSIVSFLAVGVSGVAIAVSSASAQCDIAVDEKLTRDVPDEQHIGRSAALDGDVIVIGARNDDDLGSNAGAAYVFRRSNEQWTFEQKLTASNGVDFANFGETVAIQGDTIVVGAPNHDEFLDGGGILRRVGRIYIFDFDGAQWTETATLMASDAQIFDNYGYDVAIDGDVIVSGARDEDTACDDDPDPLIRENCNSGAAYIIRFDGNTWVEEQKLVASDTEVRDQFGEAVAIQGDTAVIGAYSESNTTIMCPPGCNNDGAGAVYIYRHNGAEWVETQKLVAPDSRDVFDWFGADVAIDGDRIIMGAEADSELAPSAGSAYIFQLDPDTDQWLFEQKINASDASFGAFYGNVVDIRGEFAIVGAEQDDAVNSNGGGAYVYRFDGDEWVELSKLTASDSQSFDQLGTAVALGDNVALVSAIFDEDDGGFNTGSAYIFRGIADCDANGALDACDILDGEPDVDGNGIPDVCEGCAADLDGDGDADADDFFAYLDAFAAGDLATCDIDVDGDCDADDFFGYLDRFAQGC